MNEERLLKIIQKSYISDKLSFINNKNTIVLRVMKDASKLEIKNALYYLFKVQSDKIRTLIVKNKSKSKKYKKSIGNIHFFKKAYITFSKNQNINFIKNIK